MANTFVIRDGIEIPLPNAQEQPAFDKWLKDNNVTDPFHTGQHYDYVGAWRAGETRGKENHFTDSFKLPKHPTFSIESRYYSEGMPAGRWEGDRFVPMDKYGLVDKVLGVMDNSGVEKWLDKKITPLADKAKGYVEKKEAGFRRFKENVGGFFKGMK